jgi:translation initiation factor 3 subunit E
MLQERLKECQEVLAQDYFLQSIKDTFIDKARMAIFEVFCRIHQCIDLSALAKQMGMSREEAEV